MAFRLTARVFSLNYNTFDNIVNRKNSEFTRCLVDSNSLSKIEKDVLIPIIRSELVNYENKLPRSEFRITKIFVSCLLLSGMTGNIAPMLVPFFSFIFLDHKWSIQFDIKCCKEILEILESKN